MEKECLNCTSLKSSLAEKEVTINDLRGRWLALKDSNAEYQSRLFSDALKVQKELRAQLASLKQENERWQAADSKAVAALQSQLDEYEKETTTWIQGLIFGFGIGMLFGAIL